MARKKPYTPTVMGRQLSSAVRGMRAISKYSEMLAAQREIMGTIDFCLWMDQHGFNNQLTRYLMQRAKDTDNGKR